MGRAEGAGAGVPETALQAAWAALRGEHARLTTEEGERITVLFPGLPNHGAGPDFTRAVIATERGRLVRGDVELHRTEPGWREHGHQHDRRYDAVVLHVVGAPAGAAVTALPGGRRVPVAAIPLPAAGMKEEHPCCGCAEALSPEGTLRRLLELGRTRLRLKAQRWLRIAPARLDAELAAGLLELLGGPRNQTAMRQVTVSAGSRWLAGQLSLQALQAELLAAAGLAAPKGCQLPDPAARAIGPPPSWDMSGCRPAAHPARRLLGAGVWYRRWAEARGPAAWLRHLSIDVQTLTAALTVTADEAGCGGPAPIGTGRAAAIAVNVAYPYLLASAVRSANPATEALVYRAWEAAPALEPDTVVRSLTEALGLAPRSLRAGHQQGLHHLHRWCCQRGRQGQCLLREGVTG